MFLRYSVSIIILILSFSLPGRAQYLSTPALSSSSPSLPDGSMVMSYALPKRRSDLQVSWSSSLTTGQFQDETANKGTYSSLGLALNLNSALTPFLDLRLIPRAYFRSGHVQSNSAISARMQSFDLKEASANLHNQDNAQLSIGALNGTGYFSSALVDEDLSFPAVRADAQIGSRKTSYAGVFGEAAVPTSTTLTSNSGEDERTPSLFVGGLRGMYQQSQWHVRSHLVGFQYQGLTTGVATDSSLLGNTALSGNQSPTSEFRYEYHGVEGQAAMRWDATRNLAFEIGGVALQNQGAPGALGQGQVGSAKMDLWTGNLKWTPNFEYFKMGPDAVVALYNLPDYQTNRVGYRGGLHLQYKNSFRVKIRGGERDAVFESASQSREQFFSLTLETLDALL